MPLNVIEWDYLIEFQRYKQINFSYDEWNVKTKTKKERNINKRH